MARMALLSSSRKDPRHKYPNVRIRDSRNTWVPLHEATAADLRAGAKYNLRRARKYELWALQHPAWEQSARQRKLAHIPREKARAEFLVGLAAELESSKHDKVVSLPKRRRKKVFAEAVRVRDAA